MSGFLVVAVGSVVVGRNGSTVRPTLGASSIGILEVDVQTSSSTAASVSSSVALAHGSGSVVLAIVGGESFNFVL